MSNPDLTSQEEALLLEVNKEIENLYTDNSRNGLDRHAILDKFANYNSSIWQELGEKLNTHQTSKYHELRLSRTYGDQ